MLGAFRQANAKETLELTVFVTLSILQYAQQQHGLFFLLLLPGRLVSPPVFFRPEKWPYTVPDTYSI